TAWTAFAGARHHHVDVGNPASRNESLGSIKNVKVTLAPGACGKARRIRAGARLGEAIASEVLHRAQLRQKSVARLSAAERIDHPGTHFVDRNVGSGRRATLRQFFKYQRGIETTEPRPADVLPHVNAAEPERGRLAQALHRKRLVLIPIARMRHHFVT